ncbi:MAG: succinyl-CoA--3-ketoacid-CoA transferase [Thermotogae bacterium]|nr:MAG: succinyl-CoA--3-ketoacid-CoA transferase [Thermotogota bacterium]
MIQDSKLKKEVIAKRVAMELHDGDIVNLGIGIPTLVANYLPSGVEIFLQSENGILGMGPAPRPGFEHPQLINAGGMPVTFLPGAAAFDSAMSFGLIRGGHVDATVLGALQVDEEGHLANWMIPGKLVPGMGGAMDLVTGAKKVIVAMQHVSKSGASKIVKKCSLPLTSIRRVNLIVTDMAVIEVTENGLILKEVAPETTVEEVIKATEAKLAIPDKVVQMPISL